MHPILFQLGDFFIAWYGFFVAAGLLAGTSISMYLARRDRLDPAVILDLLLVVTVGLIVGARLFFIATMWDEFLRDPLPIILSRNGFVFLGGLVGGFLGGTIYLKMRGIPVWRVCDIVAPAIPIGHALGRVGCHMTGCCYGGICPTGWEWAGVHVPPAFLKLKDGTTEAVGGYAFFDQVDAGLISPAAETSLPVFAVQLMEAFGNVVLAAALLLFVLRRRHWAGQAFIAYLIAYSVMRFGLEFMRGDASRGLYSMGGGFGISFSQIISLCIVGAAAVAWWFGRQGKLPGQHATYPASVSLDAMHEEAEQAEKTVAPAQVAAPEPTTGAPRNPRAASRRARKK